jgi:hypothetical protein
MSSLFYANQCDIDEYVTVGDVAWSNTESFAALACTTTDDRDRRVGQIIFVNNEVIYCLFVWAHHIIMRNYPQFVSASLYLNAQGAQLANSTITHASVPITMAWHPDGKILAVGWKDGPYSIRRLYLHFI